MPRRGDPSWGGGGGRKRRRRRRGGGAYGVGPLGPPSSSDHHPRRRIWILTSRSGVVSHRNERPGSVSRRRRGQTATELTSKRLRGRCVVRRSGWPRWIVLYSHRR